VTFAVLGLVALVFKPLPERVDLFYAVLSTAGLGTLLGSGFGVLRGVTRLQRAVYAETGSLLFAAGGIAAFALGAVIQGVT
jgi:hypothetical protein